jgi:hypothetical protein
MKLDGRTDPPLETLHHPKLLKIQFGNSFKIGNFILIIYYFNYLLKIKKGNNKLRRP